MFPIDLGNTCKSPYFNRNMKFMRNTAISRPTIIIPKMYSERAIFMRCWRNGPFLYIRLLLHILIELQIAPFGNGIIMYWNRMNKNSIWEIWNTRENFISILKWKDSVYKSLIMHSNDAILSLRGNFDLWILNVSNFGIYY